MPLSDGLRAGGIYIDVGLRFDQIDRDLAELQRRIDRAGRDLQIQVRSADGGGGGSTGGLAASVQGAAATAAVSELTSTLASEMQSLSRSMSRSLDGVIDQVDRVSRATRSLAKSADWDDKIAQDFRREEMRQYHSAAAQSWFSQAFTGQSIPIDRPTGFARLPADIAQPEVTSAEKSVRFAGNTTEASAVAVAATREATATASVATEASETAAKTAAEIGDNLREGATKLAASIQRAAAVSKQAAEVADFGEISKRGIFKLKPGPIPSSSTRWSGAPPLGGESPHPGLGIFRAPTFGGVEDEPAAGAARSARAGKADLDVLARMFGLVTVRVTAAGAALAAFHAAAANATAVNAISLMGAGLLKIGASAPAILATGAAIGSLVPVATNVAAAVTAASATLFGFRRTAGGLLAIAHGVALGFNRFSNVLSGVRNSIHRIDEATKGLRATLGVLTRVITFPFRVALRHVNLFDTRVSVSTNTLRILGHTARRLTTPLTAPFALATNAVRSFTGSLRTTLTLVPMIGTAMAGAFIVKGIRGATDLEETIAKVNVSFGDAARGVHDFAQEYSDSFGIVKNQSLDGAAQIGLIAQAAGLAEQASADMGVQFTKLAADLSAFQNLSFEEALSKIKSGLVGQAVPLRAVGVLLSETAVKAKAAEMGLKAVDGQLSEGDKVRARAAIITEQLATAHGALAREANNPASLFRELRGRIANAATAIGQLLLPAWREFLLLLNDVFMGAGRTGEAITSAVATVGESLRRTIHFVRQMWAAWEDGRQLAMLGLRQVAAMAAYSVGYIRDAFQEFFGWLSDNWLTLAKNLAFNLINALDYAFQSVMAKLPSWMGGGGPGPGEFTSVSLMQGASAMSLPEFAGPALITAEMRELIDRLSTIQLRGDEPDPETVVPKPADLMAEEDAGKEPRSRVGELIGAREMLALMQGSANERMKDSKNIEKTAQGIGKLVEIVERKGPAAGPTVAILG